MPPLPKGMKEKKYLRDLSWMSTLNFCELSRAKQLLARDARLRCDLIGANCECATPVWFILSHTVAAHLLANSCSPLRFAWTTERRSARVIHVRPTSFSRRVALADLTA